MRVQAEGSTLRRGATTGWNGGASSAQELASGDGYAEYRVSSTTSYVMFGLSYGDTGAGLRGPGLRDLHLPADGAVMVFEAGVYRASPGQLRR